MANDWREVTLKDVAAEITVGHVGPMASEYVAEGIPFLRSQNVDYLRIDTNDIKYITPEFHQRLKKSALSPGDVVIVRTGKPGTCAVIPSSLPVANCADLVIVRCGDKLDSRFLAYYVNSVASPHIAAHLVGAVQQHFNVGSARTMRLHLPTLHEQLAIAHILGTLDNKIELNRRMNETLEAIARAIFKSWFVDFDPVRAKASGEPPESICRRLGLTPDLLALFPDRLVDSELGEIPEGWDVSPLSNVCTRITDGSHFSPKSVDGGRPMASVKDMANWGFQLNGCRRISEEDYQELVRNDCRPLANDVLIAKDGSYLKHIFVVEHDLDVVILSSIALLRPNEKIDANYLAFALKSETTMARMEQYVSGAVLQRIVLKAFREFPILLPPRMLQDVLAEAINPLIEKCWRNVDESETLSSLRDALLPRLLSGELHVPMQGAA